MTLRSTSSFTTIDEMGGTRNCDFRHGSRARTFVRQTNIFAQSPTFHSVALLFSYARGSPKVRAPEEESEYVTCTMQRNLGYRVIHAIVRRWVL